MTVERYSIEWWAAFAVGFLLVQGAVWLWNKYAAKRRGER